MTHPPETVHQCLALGAEGRTAHQISRLTSIPRATVRDWLAGNLPAHAQPGSDARLCSDCGGAKHAYPDLPREYVYLLGLYLGDGCLSAHPRSVFKLRIALDSAYPRIVDEAAEAMRVVLPRSKVNRRLTLSNNFEVYSYSKSWPCLLPQHGPGKKHLRPVVLEPWQRGLVARSPHLLVRALIHSDGCRFMNTGRRWRHPRYVFCNYSADIRRIFSDACDQMGVRWTTSRNVVYVSRKADVALLDTFIGPKR